MQQICDAMTTLGNLWLRAQAVSGKQRVPIYSTMSAPRGNQFVPQRPQPGQLPLMQMGYDAAQLMAQEYRSMTIRRRQAKILDLEAQLADDPLPGFHQVSLTLECSACEPVRAAEHAYMCTLIRHTLPCL